MKTCRVCGGASKVIACIEDPAVISKILDMLGRYQADIDSVREKLQRNLTLLRKRDKD